LLLAAAIAVVLLRRIPEEERLLAEEFGAEWTDYSKKTWRLIPHLY
jgi:protein-S-isoprenylcysteine O-methyltransferase Ste14